MKRIIFTFVLTLLFTVCAFAQEGVMRTWTDKSGNKVEGIYAGLSSDNIYIRLTVNGMARRWRLENFSDADLIFVGNQGTEERKAVLAVRPELKDSLKTKSSSSKKKKSRKSSVEDLSKETSKASAEETPEVEGERTWTLASGKKFHGVWDMTDTEEDSVRVVRDGKKYRIPLEKLSEKDVKFVKEQRGAAEDQELSDELADFAEEEETEVNTEETEAPVSGDLTPVWEKNDSEEAEEMEDAGSGGTLTVISEGMGETLEAARKDALSSAVQEAVGTLVDTKTRVSCEEVIQEILTYSNAYIESSKVLTADKKDGIYTVKVKANVVKTAITEKLYAGRPQIVALDGKALTDQLESKVKSEKDGVKFLANFLREEQFPYSCLKVQIAGQPKIETVGDEVKVTYNWTVEADMPKYQAFVKKLTPILDKMATKKTSYVVEKSKEDDDGIGVYEIPLKEGYFDVCDVVSGKWQSLHFNRYTLPLKFYALLEIYRRILPVAEILLLDENNNTVSIDRAFIGYGECSSCLMYTDLDSWRPSTVGESTIGRSKRHFQYQYFAIYPYCACYDIPDWIGGNYRSFTHLTFTTTFTLTKEEFSRVRSASIQVISNNPAMDEVYENLDTILDNVTTK